MKKEEKVKSAEEVWYSRNPADDGSGRFMGTVKMVMQDYANQQLKQYQEKLIEELKKHLHDPKDRGLDHYDGGWDSAIEMVIEEIESQQKQS